MLACSGRGSLNGRGEWVRRRSTGTTRSRQGNRSGGRRICSDIVIELCIESGSVPEKPSRSCGTSSSKRTGRWVLVQRSASWGWRGATSGRVSITAELPWAGSWARTSASTARRSSVPSRPSR